MTKNSRLFRGFLNMKEGGIPVDKNDKKHNDKSDKKKKADKNNPKIKTPQVAGSSTVASSNSGAKTKKTY
jgi:hypothetical protein